MKKETITYFHEDARLQGYAAHLGEERKPLVLVFPAWAGRDAFFCQKAEILAEMGYVGFAVDLYGEARIGANKEECSNLMSPFVKDRKFLQERMFSALKAAKDLPYVEKEKVAAIGFCFGGLCALDLARSGEKIKGVVTFHGLLHSPNLPLRKIASKILVLHGSEDPMVSQEEIVHFQKEMKEAGCDWQMHIFGNALHAFTNPKANDPDFGTVYNSLADKRSWPLMQNFLSEVFS